MASMTRRAPQASPDRDTSEVELDRFNQWLRAQPWHQALMRGRSSGLSRDEQAHVEQQLEAQGVALPSGMHIDQGGNLNQKNRLARNVGIGAAIGGGALTGLGLAGLGPLSGMGGGAAGAGIATGGAEGLSAGMFPGITAGLGTAGGAAGAGAAGAGAGALASAAGGGGIGLSDILRAAIPAGVATAGRFMGGVDEAGTNGAQVNTDAQLSALLAEAVKRVTAQGPLFEATNRQALAGLPAYARRGDT